jgi:hypothetical protein
MQNLGMRLLIACLIFWGGLHAIGFGMMENGSAVRGNPVWEMFGGLFDLEWMVLKGVAVVILAVSGIAALFLIGAAIAGLASSIRAKRSEEIHRSPTRYRSVTPKRYDPVPNSKHLPESCVYEKSNDQNPYAAPVPAIREQVQREIPRAETAESLKKKAIGQIMGRK